MAKRKSKKKEKFYTSMAAVEEKFFPKSSEKRSLERETDARSIGIRLAEESLNTIRGQLVK